MLMTSLDNINEIKQKRDKISELYDRAFSDICNLQTLDKGEIHGRYIYLMAANNRDLLRNHLLDHGIENKIFYSPLVCDTKIHKTTKLKVPNSRRLLKQSISIPLHEKMTIEQTKYVIRTVKNFYN